MEETIWECMSVASRIGKQIQSTETLVPKNQAQNVTPVADLNELLTTVNSARTILVPFATSSKKIKADPVFEVCIRGIKETLNDLFSFFKDLEKDFSVYTWKTQKVKVYQTDFLLKQRLDQFSALFTSEEVKDGKKKRTKSSASLILDPEGRELWTKSFGENTMMVPWNVFLNTMEAYFNIPLKDDEENIKPFLDFTQNDQISSYEFSVFLQWFAPLKGCFQRMLEALRGGLLCGFVPAVEANLLLEGKREGTYLIRFSKSQPGSFAVTFVDNMNKIKHCLLYNAPGGLTLKNPPDVYPSLKLFAEGHKNKLKHPLGNRWTLKNKLDGFAYDGKIPDGPDEKSSETQGTTQLEGNTCVVCMDAPLQTVFLECGHLACCRGCSEKLKLCPICRKPIARIIPIFRAN